MAKVNEYQYDITAANNTDVNSISLAEGMNPSAVNNAMRQLMAYRRSTLDFIGGAKVATGTNTLALTSGLSLTAYAQGQMFAFENTTANTGAVTLNVDSIGAKSIYKYFNVELEANDLAAGGVYLVAYEAANDCFHLLSHVSNNPLTTYLSPSVETFTDGVDFTAGTTTQITLAALLASEDFLQVTFDGATQHHDTFSIAGSPSVITFSSAIPATVTSVEAIYGTRTSSLLGSDIAWDANQNFGSYNLQGTGTLTFSGGGSLTGTWSDLGTVTTVDINGGTIDGTVIGGASAAAGTFTTLNATTSITGTLATAAQPNVTSLGTLTTLTVDNITINGAAITSDTGAISFGDENLTTTGTGSFGDIVIGTEVTTPSVNADELVVHAAAAGGISIVGGDAFTQNLYLQGATGSARIEHYDAGQYLQISTELAGHSLILQADNGVTNLTLSGASGSELATFAGQVGVGSAAESNKKFQVYQSSGTANQLISEMRHSGATSPLGVQVYFSGAAPDNNTQWFINCADTGGTRLTVWSDGDLANHDGTYGTLSDRFYKTDIVDARGYWDDWKAVGFKTFTKGGKKQFGVIADELEQVFPGLVHTSPDENHPDGESQWVDTMNLNHIGGRVIQELQARVEALEAQLTALSSN